RSDGPQTVVVKLREGNADFPDLLSDYHFAIMPAKDSEPDWRSGIGTGPFILKSFEPGIRIFSTRNPNYWKPNRGHFDELECIAINDPTARMNALITGAVDAINRVDLKVFHMLERNPQVVVDEVTGKRHGTIAMQIDVAPFDDVNVRMALKHAIN